MRTPRQPYEWLMSLIPLSVLVFVVVLALGGPDAFVHTVNSFASDAITGLDRWVRSLPWL